MYSQTDIGGATFAPLKIGTITIGGMPGATSAAVNSQVTANTLNVTASSTNTATAESVLVGAGALTASEANPTAKTSLQTSASIGSTPTSRSPRWSARRHLRQHGQRLQSARQRRRDHRRGAPARRRGGRRDPHFVAEGPR